MRREVREIEMKSHLALVQRMKAEQINLKALPETDVDQRNAKLTADRADRNHSDPTGATRARLAGS